MELKIVELEGNKSNRGSREEFPLSDLLDLEIRWNAEPQQFKSGLRKNNPLNLVGLDLDDDFLAERKGDPVSLPSEVTLAANKETASTGSNAFESRENLSLFENFQGSKSSGSIFGWQVTKHRSVPENAHAKKTTDDDDNDNDSFDGWNDFKGSTIAQNASQSFWNKTADGLNLMHENFGDSFFGLGLRSEPTIFETHDEGKVVDNTTSSHTTSWFQDDLSSNSPSGMRHYVEQSVANVGDKDGNNKAPDRKVVDEPENSFGDWSDFESSTSNQDVFSNSWKQAARPDN
ncbi:hypothetical protein DITRI_Ditri11bG0037800 [Diplodiscus trichospermus]